MAPRRGSRVLLGVVHVLGSLHRVSIVQRAPFRYINTSTAASHSHRFAPGSESAESTDLACADIRSRSDNSCHFPVAQCTINEAAPVPRTRQYAPFIGCGMRNRSGKHQTGARRSPQCRISRAAGPNNLAAVCPDRRASNVASSRSQRASAYSSKGGRRRRSDEQFYGSDRAGLRFPSCHRRFRGLDPRHRSRFLGTCRSVDLSAFEFRSHRTQCRSFPEQGGDCSLR